MPDIEYHQKAKKKIKVDFNSSAQKVSLNTQKSFEPLVHLKN